METAIVAPGAAGAALLVPFVLGSLTDTGELALLPLVLWLFGGAALGGLVGWVTGTALAPVAPLAGFGFGFAVGGGLGAVVRLLVVEQGDAEQPESMTVRMEEGDPGPQPADLFEAHPDPLLYYANEGEGPVVRAANDAFVEAFGVPAAAVEDAALRDTLMIAAPTEGVVDAAAKGGEFDEVLACEGESVAQFRVRVVAVSDEIGARGYVVYSPVDG